MEELLSGGMHGEGNKTVFKKARLYVTDSFVADIKIMNLNIHGSLRYFALISFSLRLDDAGQHKKIEFFFSS